MIDRDNPVLRQVAALDVFDAIRIVDAGGKLPSRRVLMRGVWRRLTATAKLPKHRAWRHDLLRLVLAELDRISLLRRPRHRRQRYRTTQS